MNPRPGRNARGGLLLSGHVCDYLDVNFLIFQLISILLHEM